jgi:uncharacterized protein (DUF58 family)
VPSRERRTFPLVPRRRRTGLPFGDLPGRRRGTGSEVIAHRPYEPGDPVSAIDWSATARLSAVTGSDAFVVRSKAADEAPRVAIVVDRRPAMSLYPPGLPWFAKRAALREVSVSIVASAEAARADIAALDFGNGDGDDAWWLPPGRRERASQVAERDRTAPFTAPDDTLERSLTFLSRRRVNLPAGSFVFVLSDFLVPPSTEALLDALGHGWDVVPVILQDPLWERSFPAVSGVGVAVADPRDGGTALVRLRRAKAEALRDEHERRYDALLALLTSLGMEPIAIESSDPIDVDNAFAAWAEERRRLQWAR